MVAVGEEDSVEAGGAVLDEVPGDDEVVEKVVGEVGKELGARGEEPRQESEEVSSRKYGGNPGGAAR